MLIFTLVSVLDSLLLLARFVFHLLLPYSETRAVSTIPIPSVSQLDVNTGRHQQESWATLGVYSWAYPDLDNKGFIPLLQRPQLLLAGHCLY